MKKKGLIFGAFILIVLVSSVYLANSYSITSSNKNNFVDIPTQCSISCNYDCFTPDSLNDTTAEFINPSFGGEDSLQEILDNSGYNVNTTEDQTNIQIWNTSNYVTLEIKFLGRMADNKQVFGYYLNNDTSTFVPIFEAGDHPNYNLPIANIGDSFQVIIDPLSKVGFAMDSYHSSGDSVIYYTENELNPDVEDHALIYDLCGEYLIGFENTGVEPDYQDIVVSVKLIECSERICGNGVINQGEECDDGNWWSWDGCSDECKIECLDYDLDGVCKVDDYCPDTLWNEPVDEYGCDIFQYCEGFSCGPDCIHADWRNNEPGEKYPRDCTVISPLKNGVHQQPKCVPTEFSLVCAG